MFFIHTYRVEGAIVQFQYIKFKIQNLKSAFLNLNVPHGTIV